MSCINTVSAVLLLAVLAQLLAFATLSLLVVVALVLDMGASVCRRALGVDQSNLTALNRSGEGL
jgi:hypothetical protein